MSLAEFDARKGNFLQRIRQLEQRINHLERTLAAGKHTRHESLESPGDLHIGGGMYVGDVDPGSNAPGVGDIHLEGDLNSIKGGVAYPIRGLYLLDSPNTSVNYDGDLFSTQSKTKIDMSVEFGVPDLPIRGYYVYAACRDTASQTNWCTIILHNSATNDNEGTHCSCEGYINNRWAREMMLVKADENGDIYIRTIASGANTLSVYMQIYGYLF